MTVSIKSRPAAFATLGGSPAFLDPIPVGQMNFPSWDRYESAMRGVFDGKPTGEKESLAHELEMRLAEFFEVRHAMLVPNATIGLVLAAKALGLRGRVVVPSFTFVASAQALTWAGLVPAFCDVDPISQQVTADTVRNAMDNLADAEGDADTGDITGVLGVNLWGGACDIFGLETLCRERGLRLFFDSAQAVGSILSGRRLGGFGDIEIFSFHATKIVNATEGGCVCTNDDDLAGSLRDWRQNGERSGSENGSTALGGSFSELQAAVALMSLDDFQLNRQRNEDLLALYSDALEAVPGVQVLRAAGVDTSNCQYAVLDVESNEFGMSRDALLNVLQAENVIARRYFYPGVHRSAPYVGQIRYAATTLPVTDVLCTRLIQMPLGSLVNSRDVERLAALIRDTHRFAPDLNGPAGDANRG